MTMIPSLNLRETRGITHDATLLTSGAPLRPLPERSASRLRLHGAEDGRGRRRQGRQARPPSRSAARSGGVERGVGGRQPALDPGGAVIAASGGGLGGSGCARRPAGRGAKRGTQQRRTMVGRLETVPPSTERRRRAGVLGLPSGGRVVVRRGRGLLRAASGSRQGVGVVGADGAGAGEGRLLHAESGEP